MNWKKLNKIKWNYQEKWIKLIYLVKKMNKISLINWIYQEKWIKLNKFIKSYK